MRTESRFTAECNPIKARRAHVATRGSSTPTRDRSSIHICVRDDGKGLPDDWTFERDAGIGLRNVAARLEHLYGRKDLLRLARLASGGVEVNIDLPIEPAVEPAEEAAAV